MAERGQDTPIAIAHCHNLTDDLRVHVAQNMDQGALGKQIRGPEVDAITNCVAVPKVGLVYERCRRCTESWPTPTLQLLLLT